MSKRQENPTLEQIIEDVYTSLSGVTGLDVVDLNHTDDLDDLAQDADLEENEDEAYSELLERVFADSEFATLPRIPEYDDVATVADLIKAVADHFGVLPTAVATFIDALDAAESKFLNEVDEDPDEAEEEDDEDVRINFMHEAATVVQIMAVRKLSVVNERHGPKMKLYLSSPELWRTSDAVEYDVVADGLTGYFAALKQALESFGTNNEIENIFEDTLFPNTEEFSVGGDEEDEDDEQ